MTRGPEAEGDWVQRLRDLRGLLGWSQRRLAKELRVTPAAVSQWEAGKRPVPGPIRRLIEVYEQSLGMIDGPQLGPVAKINGSWTARTLRLSSTSAATAARMAQSSMRSLLVSHAQAAEIKAATQLAIAERVAATLGDMKGLVAKLGQMASYMDHALPETVRRTLASLQDSVEPLPPAAIEAVFVESMGATPERLFARFNPRPFAMASIGQVHEAELGDGTRVAVKVQYPGIRAAIEADLKTVEVVDRMASTIFVAQERGTLFRELSARILEECDYRIEARNQQDFRRLHQGAPGVVIPDVIPAVSSNRILTAELIEGRRFSTFVREASQAEKDRAAVVLLRVGVGSIFKHGLFNADPHPGNYLFTDTGEVAFLDFGCVKRLPEGLMARWARYARAVVGNRRPEADELFISMGFVPDRDRFDFAVHHEIMRRFYEPFWSETPFRFNKHFAQSVWRALLIENPNRHRVNLPADFLFINRLICGLHSVLASLEARADWRALFEEITSEVAHPLAGEHLEPRTR